MFQDKHLIGLTPASGDPTRRNHNWNLERLQCSQTVFVNLDTFLRAPSTSKFGEAADHSPKGISLVIRTSGAST